MDADDRLDAENCERLGRLLGELPADNMAFACKCLCVPKQADEPGTVVDHIRLFRNLPGLQWEHHPFTLFNMGITYQELGRIAEALDFFRRSLRGSAVSDSIVRKLYLSIARCERLLGRPGEALTTSREGRAHYPEDVEMLIQESEALDALTRCLERILLGRDGEHFASVATGLGGYITRHNLAVHYLQAGRLEEAEEQWQQALAEQPGYGPALRGLADVRWPGRRGGNYRDASPFDMPRRGSNLAVPPA